MARKMKKQKRIEEMTPKEILAEGKRELREYLKKAKAEERRDWRNLRRRKGVVGGQIHIDESASAINPWTVTCGEITDIYQVGDQLLIEVAWKAQSVNGRPFKLCQRKIEFFSMSTDKDSYFSIHGDRKGISLCNVYPALMGGHWTIWPAGHPKTIAKPERKRRR